MDGGDDHGVDVLTTKVSYLPSVWSSMHSPYSGRQRPSRQRLDYQGFHQIFHDASLAQLATSSDYPSFDRILHEEERVCRPLDAKGLSLIERAFVS